jgi:membrane protein implicated in regulation of membrane protease activity
MQCLLYYDAPTWLVVVSYAVLSGLILYQLKTRRDKLLKRKDDSKRNETSP